MSCEKDKENTQYDCEDSVIVSDIEYNSAPDDHVTINNLEITGDCLKINFSSSGCSGETWKIKLIASEIIMLSNPPQRNIRLSLENKELCQAVIGKEIIFDISELQVDGHIVILNITNSNDQIYYEY